MSALTLRLPDDKHARLRRNPQFHKVVVAFIGQIGPPAEIDADPCASCQEDVQQFLALSLVEAAAPEQALAAQNVLVLSVQGGADHRFHLAANAHPNHLRRCPVSEAGAHEDVGIHDDAHGFMVAKMPSS
jgi:hypothetical protein